MSEHSAIEWTLTARIVAEVQRSGSTRATIAAVYRDGIRAACRQEPPDYVDWPTVNKAILARYTMSGLQHIKQLAWQDTQGPAPEPRG